MSSSAAVAAVTTAKDAVELKKQMTLIPAASIIVGNIVGSGIFVSPVGILRNVHSVGLSLIIWVICGIVAMLGAVCYSELGTAIPRSGGEYLYAREIWGDLVGFIVLWINLIVLTPAVNAALAVLFATYAMQPIFPGCEIPSYAVQCLAAACLVIVIIVNCLSTKWANKVQMFFSAAKLLTAAIIITIGIVKMIGGHVNNFNDSFASTDTNPAGIAMAVFSGFWAYGGWNSLNSMVGELADPNRNLPRAICLSLITIIVVYLLANVAYFAVLTPAQMLNSKAVAVDFADVTMGPAALLIPILIAFSLFGSVSVVTLALSRIYHTGAQCGHLPPIVSMLHKHRKTPLPALLTMGMLSLLYLNIGDVFKLIEYVGFTISLIMAITFGGIVRLRKTRPELKRPIKVPIVLPIVLCIFALGLVCITIYEKPVDSLIGMGIMATSIPAYVIFVAWKKKPTSFDRLNSRMTIFLQKLLVVVPEDKES